MLNAVEQHHCFSTCLQCQNGVLISPCFQGVFSVTPEVASSSLVTPAISFPLPFFFLKINLCAWPARLVRDSAARVKLLVDCLESFAGDVRVHFRGRDARVAEQFLYDAQVGAVFQQVCGETVS